MFATRHELAHDGTADTTGGTEDDLAAAHD
jgi:hypothetical protein